MTNLENTFAKLEEKDRENLYLTPVWVSLLISGVDDLFSKKEIKKAIDFADSKQKESDSFLKDYYNMVAKKFEVNVQGYNTLLPKDQKNRTDFLVEKLDESNNILKKLEKEQAHKLYLSFRDFANRVARASGGLFGLLSVSFAEAQYVDLKMIRDPSVN